MPNFSAGDPLERFTMSTPDKGLTFDYTGAAGRLHVKASAEGVEIHGASMVYDDDAVRDLLNMVVAARVAQRMLAAGEAVYEFEQASLVAHRWPRREMDEDEAMDRENERFEPA